MREKELTPTERVRMDFDRELSLTRTDEERDSLLAKYREIMLDAMKKDSKCGGNMREIKFRAWGYNLLVEREKMHGPFTLKELYENQGEAKYDKMEWLQFTGLLDKNGKEIYEGDIVRNKNGINEVAWSDEFGAWDMNESVYVADQEVGPYEPETIEVIGNIYENPDLFKDSK